LLIDELRLLIVEVFRLSRAASPSDTSTINNRQSSIDIFTRDHRPDSIPLLITPGFEAALKFGRVGHATCIMEDLSAHEKSPTRYCRRRLPQRMRRD
jgi:hypothetical protein